MEVRDGPYEQPKVETPGLKGTIKKGEACDRVEDGKGCAEGLRCAYSKEDPKGS